MKLPMNGRILGSIVTGTFLSRKEKPEPQEWSDYTFYLGEPIVIINETEDQYLVYTALAPSIKVWINKEDVLTKEQSNDMKVETIARIIHDKRYYELKNIFDYGRYDSVYGTFIIDSKTLAKLAEYMQQPFSSVSDNVMAETYQEVNDILNVLNS